MNRRLSVQAAPQIGITIVAGLREIWAHKFRSVLTMLGIILGVSSLVAMSALVAGTEKGALEALIAIGGLQKVRLEAAEVPIDQRYLSDQAVGITLNDVYALKASAPLISDLSPEMRIPGTVSANGKSFRPWVLNGVWPVAARMSEHVVEHGRMFTELDDEMARNVCVIGTGTRDQLWGSPDQTGQEIIPVGETLFINNVPFTVIGMFTHYESEQERRTRELAARTRPELSPTNTPASGTVRGNNRGGGRGGRPGSFAFYLKNTTVFIPLNTAWMKFRSGMSLTNQPGFRRQEPGGIGSSAGDPRLSGLEMKIEDIQQLPDALQQARNVLMTTHKGIEDFSFRTQEDWAEQINLYVRNARFSGSLIAAISLLVGGIGIMNIMLASISERVREIGIRKSVGASTGAIFVQILVESVVIAILGGLAGLIFSFALVRLLEFFSPTENAPIISITSMVVAFAFSVLVGVVAGLFPAVKAARLNPIQALRYE